MATKGTSVVPLLSMDALLKMKVDELVKYGAAAVETGEKAKSFSANHKASFKALGKVIAALKKLFAQSTDNPLVSTMTFSEFFQMKTGGKPNNHAEAIGKSFGFYVENGLITEPDFDMVKSDWLEKGSTIVTEVKGDVTSPYVLQAAEVMKTRPDDGADKLDAIIACLKGPKKIDAEKAREQLALIVVNGHLTGVVIPFIGAHLNHSTNDIEKEAAWEALQIAIDLCGTPEQRNAWAAKRANNARPVQIVKAAPTPTPAPVTAPVTPAAAVETPAPVTPAPEPETAAPDFAGWVRTNIPEIAESEVEPAALDTEVFYDDIGRLPANFAELDEYANDPEVFKVKAAEPVAA